MILLESKLYVWTPADQIKAQRLNILEWRQAVINSSLNRLDAVNVKNALETSLLKRMVLFSIKLAELQSKADSQD